MFVWCACVCVCVCVCVFNCKPIRRYNNTTIKIVRETAQCRSFTNPKIIYSCFHTYSCVHVHFVV